MKELVEHIKQQWFTAFRSLSPAVLNDIYAFSFLVYDEEDDPRKPSLIIGFNTISHFRKQIIHASDEQEAKWNYAFWLQNEICSIGTLNDEFGRRLIRNWAIEESLFYSELEEVSDPEDCTAKAEQITKSFINLLIQVVQETHIVSLTHLPILIHELEYCEVIKNQNQKANGAERVREFTDWIDNLYRG